MKRLGKCFSILLLAILFLTNPAYSWTETDKGIILSKEEVIKLDKKIRRLEEENERLKKEVQILKDYSLFLEKKIKEYKESYNAIILIHKDKAQAYKELLDELRQQLKDYARVAQEEKNKSWLKGLLTGLAIGAIGGAILSQ